ncbi:MAG: Fic family protein [Oscillospiraceae bacterium]
MWDTIQKLKYRASANIADAAEELNSRLNDRVELPLSGIHGEKLFLTGVSALRARAAELNMLYEKLPVHRGVKDTILLDAWSSATIEGARTTVDQVKKAFSDPKSKDDRMVVNTVAASNYAYGRPITDKNIRRLWVKIVDGVCENTEHMGEQYRDGMVYIGSASRIVHTPAEPEQLSEFMDQWFAFRESEIQDVLLQSFIAHFYFVYIHPFCDGNGRAARILNSSYLYHNGYRKMKNLPLSSAINNQLSGYYSSLSDSETVLNGSEIHWLDVSPFVSYMLDVFERCLIDAALSENALSASEKKLLERMNKVGPNAEITTAKASKILDSSEAAARNVLNKLSQKGYLTADTSHSPYIYRLQQHMPN